MVNSKIVNGNKRTFPVYVRSLCYLAVVQNIMELYSSNTKPCTMA
jgi:hypothetical protein